MSNAGYLYVLANSAMPGLVKVGKTTRTPAERANELAGVTGLPTPFIVVYDQFFEDCSAAEGFVHALLSERGYRISENREFFNAPTNEVVRIITSAPGAIHAATRPLHLDVRVAGTDCDAVQDLDQERNLVPVMNQVFADIIREAKMYYRGEGDYLQNYRKALALFKQAARLGSLYAFDMIGIMYQQGFGVVKDNDKALEYLNEGAERGNAQCLWSMGKIYLLEGQYKNADKCFSKFSDRWLQDAQNIDEEIIFFGDIYYDCHLFIRLKTNSNWETTPALDAIITANKDDIREIACKVYAQNSKNEYRRVISFLDEIL